jgi:deoxyribodipyrimidine photo-lyase
MSAEKPVIHLFRRDSRLDDNTALLAAAETGAPIVPVFVLDDRILASERLGVPRLAFMLSGLGALDAGLRARGARLLVLRGDPRALVPDLAARLGAAAVYANRDISPYAAQRDRALTEALNAHGIAFHLYDDVLIHPPGSVNKGDGGPYVVFGAFRKAWEALPTREPRDFPADARFYTPDGEGMPIPSVTDLGFPAPNATPEAGEAEALRRLGVFTDARIERYAEARNPIASFDDFDRPGPHDLGTSTLSPYLRLGMLSPRRAAAAAGWAWKQARPGAPRHGAETWISELCWRDFYAHILARFPHVLDRAFRPQYDAVAFRHAPDELDRWLYGQTGYPIVDAAMRSMHALGWMHNRARMIVASFLTKDLLIHFREGDVAFMRHLMDGDLAANNGGWQWAAGTGTDAQPYFRIFNPVSQSKKFDPDGRFIRRWVPELRDVPVKFVHWPHDMTTPPRGYPAPMVDHAFARERTLAAFRAAAPAAEGRSSDGAGEAE